MSGEKAKTLNDRQQRQSLSGSKNAKGLNRSVRNVLAKPYSVFWPLCDAQSESELAELINSLFPVARKVRSLEEHRSLRKLHGKKMKEARTALSLKIWENNPGSRDMRNYLLLGVNDVARALEADSVASVLISNEADPPILTRHLATLAATRNVPHIVVQNLKGYVKESLDFKSLAVGFKKVVAEENNHFFPIHHKIVCMFKSLELNEVHVDDKQSISVDEEKPPKSVESSIIYRDPQDIYLSRISKNRRAFVPGLDSKNSHGSVWSQYISLSGESISVEPNSSIKVSQEVLGSKSVAATESLSGLVRDAGSSANFAEPEVMDSDDFLSFSNVNKEEDDSSPLKEMSGSQKRPVKRYFSSLEPMKVKRIQSNPLKNKKKQRGKNK